MLQLVVTFDDKVDRQSKKNQHKVNHVHLFFITFSFIVNKPQTRHNLIYDYGVVNCDQNQEWSQFNRGEQSILHLLFISILKDCIFD